jgi:hypothetical protein
MRWRSPCTKWQSPGVHGWLSCLGPLAGLVTLLAADSLFARSMRTSLAPSLSSNARKVNSGYFVLWKDDKQRGLGEARPTAERASHRLHPCSRNITVGEQGQGTHLQLRPRQLPKPPSPGLLRLAHTRRPGSRETPRSPSDAETFEARAAGTAGLHTGGGSHLRPVLRLGDERGGGQGAGSLLRGGGARGGVCEAGGSSNRSRRTGERAARDLRAVPTCFDSRANSFAEVNEVTKELERLTENIPARYAGTRRGCRRVPRWSRRRSSGTR